MRERTESELFVVLANPGGSFNLGDVLLHEVLLEVLRPRGTVLVHPDPVRRETGVGRFLESAAAQLGVLKVAALARLRPAVSATVVLPPGESLKKSVSSLPKVLAQAGYFWFLRRSGVRVVVLGRSSYFDSRVNVLQELALSTLASTYSLRDLSAVDRARGRGIRRPAWCPDLSWLSNRHELQGGSGERKPSVVLCFRAEKQPGGTRALTERIGELLAQASEMGLRDFLLVQHHPRDAEIAHAIHERYGSKYAISRRARSLELDDIAPVYANATLVLTNLLHSLLLGLQCGAVSLAVIPELADNKIRIQLADMKLTANAIPLHAPVPRRCLAESLARAGQTREAVNAYRENARRAAALLLDQSFAESRDFGDSSRQVE